MKKWWSLSPKVISAALAHHGGGPVKGEPLTLNQIVSTANRIADMNEIAHPVTTAFEDHPEEDYLDALGIQSGGVGYSGGYHENRSDGGRNPVAVLNG